MGKTKKRILLKQKFNRKQIIRRITKINRQSPVAACIQFFWKVVLLPSRIEAREKITQDTNYLHNSHRGKKHTKTKNIANFYVTRNIILQSASCFQHFCCQI